MNTYILSITRQSNILYAESISPDEISFMITNPVQREQCDDTLKKHGIYYLSNRENVIINMNYANNIHSYFSSVEGWVNKSEAYTNLYKQTISIIREQKLNNILNFD